MKTKLLFLCALLWNVAQIHALTYTVATVGGYGPYQTGQGGEFTLKTTDSFMNGLAISYAATTKNQYGDPASQPNFQTFCVEAPEYIRPNVAYNVVFNDHTVYQNVYLTKGAAFLYSQFAQGTLIGYDYAAGRLGSADQLQRAIWALMGGQEGEVQNLANPFESLAVSQFGNWSAASATAAPGEYGVYVLNLWESGHVGETAYKAQDQLIWAASVPDAGDTALLLAMSFGLVVAVSVLRRKAYAQ